jgi:hypothetical protein
VSLKMCGAIPAPQYFTGSRQVDAEIGGNCAMSVAITDGPYGQPVRTAALYVDCTTPSTLPPGGFTTSTVFTQELAAADWSVTGDTVSWHLKASLLHAANIGNTVTDPGVFTWDGARVTELFQGANAPGVPSFGANGPGAKDQAAAQGSIVLR